MIGKFLVSLFSFMIAMFIIFLLFTYWVFPIGNYEFSLSPDLKQTNYNFSLTNDTALQFYQNMRYPSSDVSYKIDPDCTLQKKYDVELAINILNNQTDINLYPVGSDEEIMIACEDKIKVDERFFVAGEGGPINITRTENFNVILKGGILLLRDSKCERPNIALHELLHAFGFDHSSNPKNIMHSISKCNQIMGEDIVNTINELYSVPSHPDLAFENVSAAMRGRFLDLNVSIRNNGLGDSKNLRLKIYVDGKEIKEVQIEGMQIGYGISITLENLLVKQIGVDVLTLKLEYGFEELNKDNNIINLELKK